MKLATFLLVLAVSQVYCQSSLREMINEFVKHKRASSPAIHRSMLPIAGKSAPLLSGRRNSARGKPYVKLSKSNLRQLLTELEQLEREERFFYGGGVVTDDYYYEEEDYGGGCEYCVCYDHQYDYYYDC